MDLRARLTSIHRRATSAHATQPSLESTRRACGGVPRPTSAQAIRTVTCTFLRRDVVEEGVRGGDARLPFLRRRHRLVVLPVPSRDGGADVLVGLLGAVAAEDCADAEEGEGVRRSLVCMRADLSPGGGGGGGGSRRTAKHAYTHRHTHKHTIWHGAPRHAETAPTGATRHNGAHAHRQQINASVNTYATHAHTTLRTPHAHRYTHIYAGTNAISHRRALEHTYAYPHPHQHIKLAHLH